MKRVEFVKKAASLGYASKAEGEQWCCRHPKDEYSEKDFEELFRWIDERKPHSDETYAMPDNKAL